MTKSKTSTIAIVVLSVLLAAALASTIVLAAFTATRTASTTITFANGITVTVTGLTGAEENVEGKWNATIGETPDTTGDITVAGNESVKFDAITATVATGDAYVAVKATIRKITGSAEAPAVNYGDSVITAQAAGIEDKDGWYVVGSSNAASKVNKDTGALSLVDDTTLYTYVQGGNADAFSGASFEGNVKIVAATSLDELATMMV